jgi:glycosyltransferase involved in cell wall biosynthesis
LDQRLQQPVISVVIPARNRKLEVLALVLLIDRCVSTNIEFIVSDNSDEALSLVSKNPYCKFVRPPKVLNMTEHWNFALEHCTGRYISFLGDDDAFIPSELRKLASFLESVDVDIVWHPRATYEWPDASSTGNFYQEMSLKPRVASIYGLRKKVLSLDYKNLPIPYHDALVNARIIKLFKDQNHNSKFFGSRTPDYNSGAKILFLSETQMEHRRTVFVSGASSSSNGKLTWAKPSHPRAEEFTDLKRNPPPAWMPSLEIPIGFFWLHEAVVDALMGLGITYSQQERKACFTSILHSQDPVSMFFVAKQVWPGLLPTRLWSLAIALAKAGLNKAHVTSTFRYVLILFRVFSRQSRVVSIKGSTIMSNTVAMVTFLETSRALDAKTPITIIRK